MVSRALCLLLLLLGADTSGAFSVRKGASALPCTGFDASPTMNVASPASQSRLTTRLNMAELEDRSCDLTCEEQKLVEELFAKSAESNMQQVLRESLTSLPPTLVYKLRHSSDQAKKEIAVISDELNKILEAQLDDAKQILEELLDAGEIRKLDSLIGKAQRSGKLDVPFFNVLTINMRDAASVVEANKASDIPGDTDGAASRLQILQHIYTRCQEEVEKSIPPGLALLNRLLRQPQGSIRLNLYQHYLTPQSNKITTPDGKEIELKGRAPLLVSHEDFVSAISKTVEQIRTVENVGATDRVSAAQMVESCRQIAKEARVVIGQSFGIESPELQKYEDGLQPVFRPTSANSPYIKGQTS